MRKFLSIFAFLILLIISSCDVISTTRQVHNGTNITTVTTTKTELQVPEYAANGFVNRPEYEGIITIRAADRLSCEPNRCYREAYSSSDLWLGMEMTIVLPTFTGDENHFAKVYFSAISEGHQSNLGLVLSNSEVPVYHIFWDDIFDNTSTPIIDNGSELEYKYFPGDKIRMSVFSTGQNTLKLLIELLEPTTNPQYQNQERNEDAYLSSEFTSNHHNANKALFKRIISIEKITDTYGEVSLTDALIIETWMYRLINQEVYKLPLDYSSRGDNNCSSDFEFLVTYDNRVRGLYGGEVLNIRPKEKEGQ